MCEGTVYMFVYTHVCVGVSGCVLVCVYIRRPEVQVECLVKRLVTKWWQNASCCMQNDQGFLLLLLLFIYILTYLFCSGVKKPEFCLEYANFEAPMTSARGQSPVQTAKCALVTFRPESPLLSPWHRPERLNWANHPFCPCGTDPREFFLTAKSTVSYFCWKCSNSKFSV